MTAQKGKAFERETAALAGERGKRIARSGGYGTELGIPQMVGDAQWRLPWFNQMIVLECKHGYSPKGGKGKSMTLKREWFEKHLAAAKVHGFYPAFGMKFKFTTEDGISKYILIPFSTMKKLIKENEDMWLELEELRAYKDEQEKLRATKT